MLLSFGYCWFFWSSKGIDFNSDGKHSLKTSGEGLSGWIYKQESPSWHEPDDLISAQIAEDICEIGDNSTLIFRPA